MAGKTISDLPQELLIHICQLLYLDAIPKTSFRTLDPHSLPSSYPDGRLTSSPPWHVQATLYSLCLVSKGFYRAARPLLFRRIKITLPYSFLLLLRTLGASHLASAYDKFSVTGNVNLDPRDPASFVNMVAAAGFARATGGKLVVSVPGSRTASPYRERGRSRGREPPQSSLLSSPSRPGSSIKGKQKEETSSQQRLLSSSLASINDSSTPRTQSFRSKLVTDEDGEVELIWQEEELLSETASSESETDMGEDTADAEVENDSEGRFNVKSLGPRSRRQVQRFAVTLSQDAELSAGEHSFNPFALLLYLPTYRV
jgi:F-box-like